jgi:tetratricopeptide (TPR) repeat protein
LQKAAPLNQKLKIHIARITTFVDVKDAQNAKKEIREFNEYICKIESNRELRYIPLSISLFFSARLALVTGTKEEITTILSDMDIYLEKFENSTEHPTEIRTMIVQLLGSVKGELLITINRYEEALKFGKKLISTGFEDSNILEFYSFSQIRTNHFHEAMNTINRGLTMDPNNSTMWLNKSYVYKALNKTKDALDCINKAIKIDPENKPFFYIRAIIYLEQGEYCKSIKDAFETLEFLENSFKTEENYEIKHPLKAGKELLLSTIFLIAIDKTAIGKEDEGEEFLIKALSTRIAEEELKETLIRFLKRLLFLSQIKFLKKSLDIIDKLKGDEYTQLVLPFRKAVEYLETENMEILDRLHPEEREFVEKLIEETKKRD